MAGGTFYGTRTYFFMTADTLGMKRIRVFRHRFKAHFIRCMALQASFGKRTVRGQDMAGFTSGHGCAFFRLRRMVMAGRTGEVITRGMGGMIEHHASPHPCKNDPERFVRRFCGKRRIA